MAEEIGCGNKTGWGNELRRNKSAKAGKADGKKVCSWMNGQVDGGKSCFKDC